MSTGHCSTQAPQVVHAHDPHAVSMASLALSFGAPEPRPATIASRRVDFHLQSHAFSKWKYRQVDHFIAASEAIKEILVQDGIEAARISVVHDGIDVDKIGHRPAIELRAEYWLPHGVPVIVNVGALVGHKGQRYLIEAMPLVLREIPDAHLIIFGEGDLRPALERQVKHLSLVKRVLLPGFREDVLSLMKTADLFVMSSVTEGLGSAMLDAMSEVEKRTPITAFAPSDRASSIMRSRACSRLSARSFVYSSTSPPTQPRKTAKMSFPRCRARTVLPRTSPSVRTTFMPVTELDVTMIIV